MPIEIKAGSGIPVVEDIFSSALLAEFDLITAPTAAPLMTVPWFPQRTSNWCWAASAQMVLHFYQQTTVKQCDVARVKFNGTNCCTLAHQIFDCDHGCTADEVALIYKNFNIDSTRLPNPIDFKGSVSLDSEININRRPVEVGLQWPHGNGKHLVIVFACFVNSQDEQLVSVNDPWLGKGLAVLYDSLKSAYSEEHGEWISTWTGIKPGEDGNHG